MELIKLYAAILRRRWLLVQAVVLFTLSGVAAALLLPKSYQATAKMMVTTSDATTSILSELGLQEVAKDLSGASDDIQNHIALATSRPILEQLAWKLQLRDDDGRLLNPDKLLVPGLLGGLEAAPRVEVNQYQGADIVLVTATSDDAEQSRLMADTLVRTYIQRTQDTARRETREARGFIEDRLEIVRQEFDRALGQIADVQQREQVVDLESEVKSAVSRLSDLLLSAEENAAKVQEVRARLAELEELQGRESADFIGPATVAGNPDIRSLREELATLRQKRQSLLLDKTAEHPDVKLVETQIAAVQAQIEQALAEQHTLDPDIDELRTELAGLLDKGKEIQQGIKRTTQRFALYPQKMRELSQLKLAADAAEEVYRSLQDERYQIAIAEAMTLAPLQFVEPAHKPDRPVSPKLLPSLAIGLALGLLSGLGLVALFEYVDDSIKSQEQLRDAWDSPQLGVVPRYKAGPGITVASFDPTDPVVESFRTLRSGIAYATLDAPAHLLAVTSSMPGEGKSTVLVNLAISFAAEGRRVLIVDCDLRRPSLHTFFPTCSSSVGVTSVMLGSSTLDEAIQDTTIDKLHLVPSGPVPPNPGKLVESLKLRQLLLEAAKRYDLILVDTPPVLAVNDALVVGRLVDHVLVVVEAGSTARRALIEARGRMHGGGVDPLGLVLNKVTFSTGGYGYYYQRAYRHGEKGRSGPRAQGGAA